MNHIKTQIKEAIIAWANNQPKPVDLTQMPISVFDEPLKVVVKELQSLYEDCQMALSDEWDRSDSGFEAMRDSIEELLGDDIPEKIIEKTEDTYEEYLNTQYDENYTWNQVFDNFVYFTNKDRGTECITEQELESYFLAGAIGTLIRELDPIRFQTGYNDWQPQ